jgi:DNA processing protein
VLEEREAWLRLALAPGISASTARVLLATFGLPDAIFAADRPAQIARLVGEPAARALLGPPAGESAALLDRANAWLDAGPERNLICLADADYPPALLALADAPLVLFAAGRRELLRQPALAVVGSRSATRQGLLNAAAFAAALARSGLCIVSGMARGIDGAAHRGALDAQGGTVAVLGTGPDVVYPAAHARLASEIAGRGLLLSEYAPGTPPRTHHFPQRNRLIAALSRGVLVVEATTHSGSLITARLAGELGREVFAIPGSIHSPQARGCHRLIRDGAKLVERAQDVLEELHIVPAAPAAQAAATPTAPAQQALLAAMGDDPVHIDTLAHHLDDDSGATAAALLELELAGRVERLPGNRFQLLHS